MTFLVMASVSFNCSRITNVRELQTLGGRGNIASLQCFLNLVEQGSIL